MLQYVVNVPRHDRLNIVQIFVQLLQVSLRALIGVQFLRLLNKRVEFNKRVRASDGIDVHAVFVREFALQFC